MSHEKTMSFTTDKGVSVYRSVINGREMSAEGLKTLIRSGLLKPMATFKTQREADEWAVKRSRSYDRTILERD